MKKHKFSHRACYTSAIAAGGKGGGGGRGEVAKKAHQALRARHDPDPLTWVRDLSLQAKFD